MNQSTVGGIESKMSFSEKNYAQIRPFLYHLTFRENMGRIAFTRRLQSAATLHRIAGQKHILTCPRRKRMHLTVGDHRVILNCQATFHENNAQFTKGWSLPKFVKHLNRHVFFWSGWERGPVKYGVRYFGHYSSLDPVIIRARFVSVRKQNSKSAPLFCRYNSGSPRWSNRQRSCRGPETFAPAESCGYTAGKVTEVVFRDFVVLPDDTESANSLDGPWRRLWGRSPNRVL